MLKPIHDEYTAHLTAEQEEEVEAILKEYEFNSLFAPNPPKAKEDRDFEKLAAIAIKYFHLENKDAELAERDRLPKSKPETRHRGFGKP